MSSLGNFPIFLRSGKSWFRNILPFCPGSELQCFVQDWPIVNVGPVRAFCLVWVWQAHKPGLAALRLPQSKISEHETLSTLLACPFVSNLLLETAAFSSIISSWKLFQKTIKGFGCKVNGLALAALGSTLVLLRLVRWQAQTQGLSRLAIVAAGCYCFALEKILPLLRYWLNLVYHLESKNCQNDLLLYTFCAVTTDFFSLEMEYQWISQELVTDQSSTHGFDQSC